MTFSSLIVSVSVCMAIIFGLVIQNLAKYFIKAVGSRGKKLLNIDVALAESCRQAFCFDEFVHPFVNRIGNYDVVNMARPGLRNTVDSVLRLKVIIEAKTPVIKDAVIGDRQGE